MDLKEKVRNLPNTPGVYLMKDSLDNIIYVGKSKNLKSRVGSYFVNSKAHSPKILKLVRNLKDFDFILTDTEFEAFMLECKLIKEIKPRYNKLMKSSKSYTYIKISINEEYPEIEISNESNLEDGNLYFGPYTSKGIVTRGIQSIKEHYKILCSNPSRKGSSCLNYSLGLCMGICLKNTSIKEKYLSVINKLINLLRVSDKTILEELESVMVNASENFDFEKAAKYRDYISQVNYLVNSLKIIEFTEENRNIALIERLQDDLIKFFLIKGNKVLFSEKYSLSDLVCLQSILKSNILLYFNNEIQKKPISVGKEEFDESQIIYSYIKSKSSNCNHIIIPDKWLTSKSNTFIDKGINKLLT